MLGRILQRKLPINKMVCRSTSTLASPNVKSANLKLIIKNGIITDIKISPLPEFLGKHIHDIRYNHNNIYVITNDDIQREIFKHLNNNIPLL